MIMVIPFDRGDSVFQPKREEISRVDLEEEAKNSNPEIFSRMVHLLFGKLHLL